MNKYLEKIINKYPQYNFDKFEYINSTNKSIIICNIHGEFKTNYINISRSGSIHICPKCKKENNDKDIDPIEKLRNKFPNMIFNKSKYKGYKENITITCPIHGDISERYDNLLLHMVNGCKFCSLKDKYKFNENEKEEYINKLKNKFPNLDFSKFIYIDSNTKVILICKEHGEFESIPSRLMFKTTKYGCPYCAKNKAYNPMKVLEDKFSHLDFSNFNYVNYTTFSNYRCKIHNIELSNTYGRLKDKRNIYGCPKCKSIGKSKPEEYIANKIKEYYNMEIDLNNINTIRNENTNRYMELDIYLPNIKLAIEFNGKYYHSDEMICKRSEGKFNSAEEYHNFKTKMCSKENIYLIHINEEEWLKDKDNILESLEKEIKSRI